MASSPTPLDFSQAPVVPVLPNALPTDQRAPALAVSRSRNRYGLPGGLPTPPITFPPPREIEALFPGPDADAADTRGRGAQLKGDLHNDGKMLLELADGSAFEGYGFGADKNISGECVFQTGEDSPSRRASPRLWPRGCTRDIVLTLAHRRSKAWSATPSR